MAEIRAVEDEDIMCLGDGVRKRSAAVMQGMGGSARIDPATQKHHEAIFSPTGSSLSHNDSAAVSTQILAPQQTGPDANTNTARVGSAGVVGAAARARLALTGKGGELPKITTHARVTTRPRSEERSCAREDEEGQPLFKTLRVRAWIAFRCAVHLIPCNVTRVHIAGYGTLTTYLVYLQYAQLCWPAGILARYKQAET